MFALQQLDALLFGLLALVDIDQYHQPLLRAATGIVDRHAARQVPAILAVGRAAHAQFRFIGCARSACLPPGFYRLLAFVGMDLVHPFAVHALLEVEAAVFDPVLVDELRAAVAADDPYTLRRNLHKRTVTFLTVAQPILGALAVGDVSDVALQYPPAIRHVGIAGEFGVLALPGRRDNCQVIVAVVVFLTKFGEGRAAARLIVKQPDVPQGLGEKLLARLAQQLDHVRVDVGNAARIGIEKEHPVRRCLEQPAIAHLRCIQRRAGAALHEVDSRQQEAKQNSAQGDVRRNAALRCLFEFRARGERHSPGATG